MKTVHGLYCKKKKKKKNYIYLCIDMILCKFFNSIFFIKILWLLMNLSQFFK